MKIFKIKPAKSKYQKIVNRLLIRWEEIMFKREIKKFYKKSKWKTQF